MTSRLRKSRIVIATVAVATASVMLAACGLSSAGTSGGAEGDITIGGTFPLSGPLASYAADSQGLQAYLDSINAKGGVHGRKIKYKALDDQYEAQQSLTNVRELVEQDHASIVTTFGSVATADEPFMQSAKIPFIADVGDTDMNYNPKYTYVRTSNSDERADAEASAEYTSKHYPNARVGLLVLDNDVASTITTGLDLGLSNGAKLTATQLYPSTATELSAYINKLRADKVTDLYILAVSPTLQSTLEYIKQIGWKVRTYVFQNDGGIYNLKTAGSAANGVISSYYYKDPADPAWANNPGMEQYRQIIKKYGGGASPQNLITLMGFTTGELIVKALQTEKGDSATDFLNAWDAIDSSSFIGFEPGLTIKYSPIDGRPIHSEQIVQYKNGSWKPLGPILSVPPITKSP